MTASCVEWRDSLVSGPVDSYLGDARQTPLWLLVLGWIVLLPLSFFTTGGEVMMEGNKKIALVAASDSTLSHRLPIAVALLICSALVVSRFQSVFSICRKTKLLLAIPILAILSVEWSGSRQQTAISATVLLIFTLFASYISSCFGPRRQFEMIVFTGAVVLFLSLVVIAFLPDVGRGPAGWSGIFGEKNSFSWAVTMMLITAVHWSPRGFFQRYFRLMFTALCLLMIVMSKSRGGWALACLALLLTAALALIQRMPARESIAVSLAAIPLLIGAGYIVYEFGPLILYAVGKDPTLTQRTIIWAAAWGAAKQNLMLGYGYAAFWTGTQGPAHTITLVAGWALQQSQNGYLDVWLQLGVVGVGIVAIMLLKSVRDVTRCFRGSRHPGYVRWCMVVLICIVVQNVGESSLCFARLSWLMFLLAFAGLSQAARAGRRVDTPLPRPDLLEREVSERGIPELEVFETVVLETRGRLSYAEPAALE